MLAARSGVQLSDRQRLSWLRLIRSENVGPATFRALVNQFGGAEAALDALPALSRRGGRASIRVFTEAEAEAELDSCRPRRGPVSWSWERRAIRPRSPMSMRRRRSSMPKAGSILPTAPIVAMVGARNGSAVGQKLTRAACHRARPRRLRHCLRSCPRHRHCGTSCLARARDHRRTRRRHRRGLPAGECRPSARHRRTGALAERARSRLAPRGKDFPRRNRLISGISLGVVVVEAAERSGSLITARFAGEQGREVFAVPGSPLDPRSAGTNNLLKQGACLVTSARDIVEALALDSRPPRSSRSGPELSAPRKGYHLNPCPKSRKASGSGSSARLDRARSISTRSPGPPALRYARCISFCLNSISRESCSDTDSNLCH